MVLQLQRTWQSERWERTAWWFYYPFLPELLYFLVSRELRWSRAAVGGNGHFNRAPSACSTFSNMATYLIYPDRGLASPGCFLLLRSFSFCLAQRLTYQQSWPRGLNKFMDLLFQRVDKNRTKLMERLPHNNSPMRCIPDDILRGILLRLYPRLLHTKIRELLHWNILSLPTSLSDSVFELHQDDARSTLMDLICFAAMTREPGRSLFVAVDFFYLRTHLWISR